MANVTKATNVTNATNAANVTNVTTATTNVTSVTSVTNVTATATAAIAPPPPADPEWAGKNRAPTVTNAGSVTSACGAKAKITLRKTALTGRKPKQRPPTSDSICG